MLPVVTLTLAKCITSEKNRQDEEGDMLVASTMNVKPFLFWRSTHCWPSSAPVLITLPPNQLNLFNNPFGYLTEQISIPVVSLT